MSVPTRTVPAPPEFPPLPNVKLIETDGVPLESPWHVAQISLLLTTLAYWWRDRTDFYIGGNMFIYYTLQQAESVVADPVRTTAFKGPDFFYVASVNRFPPRPYWAVWEEDGQYPDLIIELLSPTTARSDLTTKKDLYERIFRTHEYYCFDFDANELIGWRLGGQLRYEEIAADKRHWMWSEELGLWLGTWKGVYQGIDRTWLRFYDANGQLVPLPEEAERHRAEAAEAEAARLKARLAKLEGKGTRAKGRKRS